MALVISNPIFQISGKVGKYVIKKFNGKRVLYLRPSHYKKTKSEKALAFQSKFGIVSRFATQVNAVPILRGVWKQSSLKGFSSYHKILRSNIKLTESNSLGEDNVIVPSSIPFPGNNISLHNCSIKITAPALFNLISEVEPAEITLQIVLAFQKPIKQKTQDILFSVLSFPIAYSDFKNSFEETFVLTNEHKRMMRMYRHVIVFTTLIWKRNKHNKYEWFSTFSKSFEPCDKKSEIQSLPIRHPLSSIFVYTSSDQYCYKECAPLRTSR